MAVDDELSTPMLHSDEEMDRSRRRYTDDELDGAVGCGAICCSPTSRCHRFIALILMCLVGFGKYYSKIVFNFIRFESMRFYINFFSQLFSFILLL